MIAVELHFGVDTLSYHCRLVADEIGLLDVAGEAAALGAEFVQLNACHLAGYDDAAIDRLVRRMATLGLTCTLSGEAVGRASRGDTPAEGAARVRSWLALAARLHSPFVRVSSGFYRNELRGDEAAARAELDYVVEVLTLASTDDPGRTRVLLENHSDFTPEEYLEIVERVGADKVGVFLDLINPVSLLLDPVPVVRRLAPLAVAGHAKDYRLVSHYVEDGFHRRGFEVQWCYPGEGVAPIEALLEALVAAAPASPYHLSIEGLDNRAGIADQQDRLRASLEVLRAAAGTATAASTVC